jgi:prevent-host-death family protein
MLPMAESVNILDARNNLSKLVSAAEHGVDTVISRRGRAVARITGMDEQPGATGAGVADWLAANPLPPSAVRAAEALDEQVRAEREGWE